VSPYVPSTWSGVFPAVLTMFDADGRIDEPAMRAHLDRLVNDGAHGVIVAGTSGEFISLDDAERRRLFEIAVDVVAGRVPVIAGTGTASTASTIALTRDAAAIGVDGVIVILPYYQRPSLAEVLEHFRAVGRAAPVPVMVYDNPANSAAPALEAGHLAALYRDGDAVAVKSTFPTVHQVHETRALTDEGFRVFYGSFQAPLEAMAGGAHGWISGILNVVLADALDLWAAVGASDLVRARAAWSRIAPYRRLYTEQPLGPVSDLAIWRGVLALRGQAAGHCRRPILDLESTQQARLRDILVAEVGSPGRAG
jgi:4-hydroxy-tetrahydrodipicolinate synthase